jgi:hypothetical protein
MRQVLLAKPLWFDVPEIALAEDSGIQKIKR